MGMKGSNPFLATVALIPVQGVGALVKALPFWADDGNTSGRRLLPWKRPSINLLLVHGAFFLGVKP
jgi:hypothetical protein